MLGTWVVFRAVLQPVLGVCSCGFDERLVTDEALLWLWIFDSHQCLTDTHSKWPSNNHTGMPTLIEA